jgi:surface polysaccharide O-acyltransferase-like enzyme
VRDDPRLRELWPDLVRIWATVSVVLLHAASVPVSRFERLDADAWLWADFYRSLTSTCIPLFVMLSGALLLNAPAWNARAFFRRRLDKVIVPLLAWSAVYGFWARYFQGQDLTLTQFLERLVGGISNPPYVHLWFLYLILSLYLLVPIFRIYVVNASAANQAYFAGLSFVATAVIPALAAGGLGVDLYLAPVAGFIGYFVLGATLVRFLPPALSRPALFLAAAAVIVGLIATTLGTYVLSSREGKLYENLYAHLAPNVALMSVPTFLLLRHLGTVMTQRTPGGALRAIAIASELSFGIYLAHVLVMEVLESGALGFALGRAQFHPSFGVPLVATVVLLSTALVVAGMRRWWLRWMVP